MNPNEEFVKYPTGKIPTGGWCDTCKRYNTRNVTCSIIGIMNDRILLIKRRNEPMAGFWAMPGGYLSWDETVEEAATREFAEETGWKVTNLKLLGVYSDPHRDEDGRQNVDCCFVGEVTEKNGEADNEVSEVKWFNLNQVPEKMAFDHGKMLGDYLNRKFI
jgi:ADP-ribose pyrophosphatase YjhB (NUDIX family)